MIENMTENLEIIADKISSLIEELENIKMDFDIQVTSIEETKINHAMHHLLGAEDCVRFLL